METNKRTGVIVARIQCPFLHKGYRDLIDYVTKQSDSMLLILGDSPLKLTDRNPLSFEMRVNLIQEIYPFLKVERLEDHPSDEVWSTNLDNILHNFESPTLYGSRDSFIKQYTGNYAVREVEALSNISSTEIRKQIGNTNPAFANQNFMSGIIYAIENKYPTVYPTVDIAILNSRGEFLLGKKKGHTDLRFIGGFIDPADESSLHGAFRELNEEVKGVKIIVPLEYIGSYKIDDWRYKGTKDSILTSFYAVVVENNILTAADDIAEVEWCSLENFNLELLHPAHHILFNSLKKYLNA